MDKSDIQALIRDLGSDAKGEIGENAEKLIKIGEPAVPALISALKDSDITVRIKVISVIMNIGKPAIPYLIAALNDENEKVKWSAAALLDGKVENLVKEGQYSTALKIIKAITNDIRKIYKGKKERDSLIERRKQLARFESYAQQIHNKMNPDKKKFPVKHQQVRRTQARKVTSSG